MGQCNVWDTFGHLGVKSQNLDNYVCYFKNIFCHVVFDSNVTPKYSSFVSSIYSHAFELYFLFIDVSLDNFCSGVLSKKKNFCGEVCHVS